MARWRIALCLHSPQGYLALRAQRGLTLIEIGKSAFRELRSNGRENVWLCQMGRQSQDGDFAQFQAKVAALPVEFSPLAVRYTSLRGAKTIDNFPHFDNPYAQAPWPTKKLGIKHNGQSLTLDFAS